MKVLSLFTTFGIFSAPFQLVTQNVVFQPGFSTPTLFTPTTNNGATFLGVPH